MKGRVKWWSNERGYGFIEYDSNESIFAHLDNSEEKYPLKEDQEIEFLIEENERGKFLKILNFLEN